MWEWIKSLVSGFGKQAQQRLEHPFALSFIIAALVVNWRMVFIVLGSDLPIEARILYADFQYGNWCHNFWAPIGIATIYTFGLPWLNIGVSWVGYWVKMYQLEWDRKTLELLQEQALVREAAEENIPKSPEVLELTESIEARETALANIKMKMQQADNIQTRSTLVKEADTIIMELRGLRDKRDFLGG